MPKRRYERQTPTHEWSQIRPLLKDAAQIKYELIRPVILWGVNVKERAAETGEPRSTIYHQANLFDQAGMASLLPPVSPPPVPKLDKRTLPPPMRQAIVDVHAEYPEHHIDEIARIMYAQFGRRPSAQTIKLTLANGPKPSRTTRRFPLFEDVTDPRERRLAIIKLHAEGWTPTSIAGYLGTSRRTVHTTLNRWIEEQFAGLADKSSRPHQPAMKTTLRAMQEVKKMQINPELGEYRVSAALEQLGIKLSPRTCGRILALNRQLYHLQMPRKSEHTKKELPFQSDYRHHYWFVDIRYLDMHKLGGEMIYCISVLDGYSRAILASAVTRRQNFEEYIAVLYAAIRKHGCPTALVSDHGGVFRDHRAMQIYQALGIQKEEIEKRQSWQNLIETALYVMWNLENSLHNLHYVDLTLDSFGIFKSNEGQFHIISIMRRMSNYHFEQVTSWEGAKQTHRRFVEDYNHQPHWGHRKRDDNRHTPAEVLGWVTGKMRTPEQLHRIFYATRFLRFLDRFGYARFRRWRLYAEAGLARRQSVLWLYGDTLTLEYANAPLSQYTVEYQPDKKHFRRVREPRHFETPYQSPQQPLWEPEAVEWHPAQRLPDYAPRRFRKHQKSYVQSPLLDDE